MNPKSMPKLQKLTSASNCARTRNKESLVYDDFNTESTKKFEDAAEFSKRSNLEPPDFMLPWLTYTNKLTSKLYQLTNNTNLKVLSHAFTNPSWWDKYVLNIRLLSKLAVESEVRDDSERRTGVYESVHEDSSTESTKKFASAVEFRKKSIEFNRNSSKEPYTPDKVLHRDILISAGDISCWFARTIITSETYFKHAELFSRLKNETLGDLIFADNGIFRKYLKYYPITQLNIEYNWLKKFLPSRDLILWARLSKFSIQDDAFFLFEVFLPGLEKFICLK